MFPDAYYNLGVAYCEAGSIDKSIICYELAINFNPRCCEAYNNLGVIYKDQNNLERAIECYLSALQVDPVFYQTLNNLSVVYTLQGELDKAREHVHLALKSNNRYAEAFNNLGVLCREEGKTEEAIKCYKDCMNNAPNNINAAQNHLLALNFREQPLQVIFDLHKQWGIEYQKFLDNNYHDDDYFDISSLEENDVLRVGYFCPDFFIPLIETFVEGILRNHDQENFEIYWFESFLFYFTKFYK